MSGDDIIVPPSWLVPPRPDAAASAEAEQQDVIALPPGIADSATFKLLVERDRPSAAPAKPDVVFYPVAPGAPPVSTRLPGLPVDGAVSESTVSDITITDAAITDAAVSDETVHVSRPTRSWRLVFPGSPPVVVGGPLYVGRNPSALEQHAAAALLPVDDPLKSVSKTHALLELDAGGLWLTDLHSTNGSSVVGTDGVRVLLDAGSRSAVEPGSTIELGDFAIQVEHG